MTIKELIAEYGETAEVFAAYAETVDVSLEHEDDWLPWWQMFNAGVNWQDEDYRDEDE